MKQHSCDNNDDAKKLLVVGGGFLGGHVAHAGQQRGYSVDIVKLKPVDNPPSLVGAEYIVADIADSKIYDFAERFSQYTHVINLAGYIDHSKFMAGGSRVLETHFLGLLNLIKLLDFSTLESFVQVGSSDEYGDAPAPQVENSHCTPFSCYSVAKLSATQFMMMLCETEGFPATVVRPFLVYGPGQDSNRFLPQIIKSCLRNEDFPVSPGNQLRDFCYIDDFVNGMFCALESSNSKGQIINIASGKAVTIRTVVEMVVQIVGAGNPNFGGFDYRRGENMELYADIRKAKELLNWSPYVELNEGLSRTINSYEQ